MFAKCVHSNVVLFIHLHICMNDQQTCVADKKVINFHFMNLPQLYKE